MPCSQEKVWEREKQILWRLLFVRPGEAFVDVWPSRKDNKRCYKLERLLPPVHLPIPDELDQFLNKLEIYQIKLIQEVLYYQICRDTSITAEESLKASILLWGIEDLAPDGKDLSDVFLETLF